MVRSSRRDKLKRVDPSDCRKKDASSPWPETASTTRRPWRRQTWASPWERRTDVAMNSTAVIPLVKGDLRGIAVARTLSVSTVRKYEAEPHVRLPLQRAGHPHRRRGSLFLRAGCCRR
ncbi:hypothetical protein ACPA9J_03800 [Pseudomonas aeruginosa]